MEAYDPSKNYFAGPIKKLINGDLRVDKGLAAPALVQDPQLQAQLSGQTPPLADLLFDSPVDWIMDGYRRPAPALSGALPIQEAGAFQVPADFEAIFLPDAPRKAGLIIPQLAFYDIRHAQLLGTNLWHSPQLLEMARRYVQGAIFTDGVHFGAEGDAKGEGTVGPAGRFRNAFRGIYGAEPDLITATAFDTAEILFSILSEPEIRMRRDVRNRLRLAGPFPGITGQTAFSPRGEAEKALHLLQIQGRRFVELERRLASPTAPLPTDPPPERGDSLEAAFFSSQFN